MKTECCDINDYYPLYLDIGEGCDRDSANPVLVSLSARDLVKWADERSLTALQILTLLIKNAFEGHLCHLNGIPLAKLAREGTIQIDFGEDDTCGELSCDFFDHLPDYMNGITGAYLQSLQQVRAPHDADVLGMFYFLLSNQLFRLPVAYLKNFDTEQFIAVSNKQTDQLRNQYLLHSLAMSHAAHRSFIDLVDNRYADRFKEVLLKLSSKETVLMQLLTKLDYANDPSIKTEEQLEKKYFEFLVATNVTRFEKREPILNPELTEQADDSDFKEFLRSRIKKLYKTISLNCAEVHNRVEGQESYSKLNEYFIAASSVYNAFHTGLGGLMLQHSRLVLMCAKVLNYRAVNRLPLHFIDFAGKINGNQLQLREEDIAICQLALQRNLELLRMLRMTAYKVKYLKDEEMSKIHHDFLLRQLEYIESRIFQVMDEISRVMKAKAENIA